MFSEYLSGDFALSILKVFIMASQKIATYTQEQTEQAKAEFLSGVAPEVIAAAMGKSVRSIIAKLSREGVYKAKEREKAATSSPAGETKQALAAEIASLCGLLEADADTLAKANKAALVAILAKLKAE